MIEPKESIKLMKEYTPPNFDRKGFVRLDCNENVVGCSKKVLLKLKQIDQEYLSLYPNYSGLNEKVAKYAKVNQKEILVTNACDDALKVVFDCFIEKNDESIILDPTFAVYELFLNVIGAKIKKVQYNKDLTFPIGEVIKQINSNTKLIVLCNPNNPTGTIIQKKEIINILEKAKNSVVLVDEAYFEFSKETCSDLINKYKNLIITRTFSKAFGLAGIRAGYIISSENNINYLKKIYGPYNLNSLAKIAITTAIEDKQFAINYSKEIMQNKASLEKELNKLGIKTYQSKGNFLLAEFNNPIIIKDKLKEKRILVRDVTKYTLLQNCLRITSGTKKENKLLINALKEILKPALIFDMDGVLVDVNNSYRIAIKQTAEFFTKKEVTQKEIQSYKEITGYNNDWDLTEAIILSRGKKIPKQEIIDKFQEYYLGKNFDGLITKEKWMLDKKILSKLSKKYTLSIFTGRPKIEAEFALKINNTAKYFSLLVGMEDVLKGKPDPEGIYVSLKKLGIINGIYFGDTPNDEIAAKKANVGYRMVKDNVNEVTKEFLKKEVFK
ncbi:MAG: histidinol-phosphate transaminase [archaeon]|jgi:histidinol-phosphate aminotransferase